MRFVERLHPGSVWKHRNHPTLGWVFVGPRYTLYDQSTGIPVLYTSPVVSPNPADRHELHLSMCDTSRDTLGTVLVEPVAVPVSRKSCDTAISVAEAYDELMQAIDIGGLHRLANLDRLNLFFQ